MKVFAISVLAVSLLAFVPAASAEMDTQVCLPAVNNPPVYGCTQTGFEQSGVYYYEADASQWTQKCVWLVCAYTPDVTTSPAHLMNAPIVYSSGEFHIRCIKGQTCPVGWDTRDILDSIALSL